MMSGQNPRGDVSEPQAANVTKGWRSEEVGPTSALEVLYAWLFQFQILEAPFWSHEACDAARASWRNEYEACDDEPLSSLPHEFENEIMKDKAKKLSANYSEYRKVPGDGSCFYRSFIYSYLEQLVKVSHEEELRLLGALETMWEKFQRLRLPGSYSDLRDAFVGFILECMEQKQKLSVSAYQEWLFQESQNEQKFANMLLYLRLVTAIEICTEVEQFKAFIADLDQGKPDATKYCLEEVLPVEEDAQQVNLTALTNVLQVPLRVVNIDVSPIEEPNIHIIYESPDSSVPTVTLLYRPGHYDIIYEKS
uniref:ubiquitinyl hydrolase 1 n=1 Tax=Aegilops tauschii TaxID=37682 RepID=M8BYY9_AEGTA